MMPMDIAQFKGMQMTAHMYYQVIGEVVGPLSNTEIHRRIKEGVVTRDTLIRRGEDGEWVLADHVKGLFYKTGNPVPPNGPE